VKETHKEALFIFGCTPSFVAHRNQQYQRVAIASNDQTVSSIRIDREIGCTSKYSGSTLLLGRGEGFVPRRKPSKRDLPCRGGRAFSVKRYSIYVLFICGASGFDGGDRTAKRGGGTRRKGVLIAEGERRDRFVKLGSRPAHKFPRNRRKACNRSRVYRARKPSSV